MSVNTLDQAVATATEQLAAAQAAASAARVDAVEHVQETVKNAGEQIKKAAAAAGIKPVRKPTKMQTLMKVAIYATGTAVVVGAGYYAWKRFGPQAALAVAEGATDVAQAAAETAVAALMA